MPTNTKPLSDESKKYVFDELQKFSTEHPDIFRQKLIQAACNNSKFPPIFSEKFLSLQLAYQANHQDQNQKPLLMMLLENYFNNEGLSLFINEVLKKPFVANDWTDHLARTLVGSEIQIPDDILVEATIKAGKVYWCVHYGEGKVTYRRENCPAIYSHKSFIDEAREQNRTFSLTWDNFRNFKDAGKRTGTVVVTAERFANEFQDKPLEWSQNIHAQLTEIGILDIETYKLSSSWYPLSQAHITLENVAGIDYQRIATALQNITNNPAYHEEFSPGLIMYRPACAAKLWKKTGLIQNDIDGHFAMTQSKPWDVAVYSELSAYGETHNGFEVDHIPSKAQIKIVYEPQIHHQLSHLLPYSKTNVDVKTQVNFLQNRLKFFKSAGDGPKGFWCIYVTKSQHDFNPTTRLSDKKQAELSPFDSINKYLDIFEEDLKERKITLSQFIQILGAFRYLVSRMCKNIENIENEESKVFIHHEPNCFFSTPESKRQLDNLFISKMQNLMGS